MDNCRSHWAPKWLHPPLTPLKATARKANADFFFLWTYVKDSKYIGYSLEVIFLNYYSFATDPRFASKVFILQNRSMSHELSDSAKDILEDISAIIADIDNDPDNVKKGAILSKTDGEVSYGTRLLVRKVSDLIYQMSFPEVSDLV